MPLQEMDTAQDVPPLIRRVIGHVSALTQNQSLSVFQVSLDLPALENETNQKPA